jgi:hypothetical protein
MVLLSGMETGALLSLPLERLHRNLYMLVKRRGSVRTLARLDHWKLSERMEEALKKLGFSYLKNQGRNVTEFMVQSPCHLNVTVENLTRDQIGFPFRSRIRVESAVEFRRAIEARESEPDLRRCATALIGELQSELPEKRWMALWDFG